MKEITVLLCYIFAFTYCNAEIIDASYDYPDPASPELTTSSPPFNCTAMKFACSSCSELVMCIATEFGFTQQRVTCPAEATCLRDKCTTQQNPLCDGTADVPFQCHVPGVFPDPFDCRKYHFCVPRGKMVNGTLKVKRFSHSCQEDGGVQYRNMTPNSNSSDGTTFSTLFNCTAMKFQCSSCSELVMCIATEFGFTQQRVTCPAEATCLRDKCTTQQNPLCDGTADVPFQCHVPGVFPDPFDCRKYHFCVPKGKVANGTLKVKRFSHSCQDDGGVQYRYDPQSRYCKFKIENGCQEWPVPLCKHKAQNGALEENKSIFYVCEMVDGHLYPHLYACPHGEEYNHVTTNCTERIYDYLPLKSSTDEYEENRSFAEYTGFQGFYGG